jgi:hypothetical protein
VAVPAPAPEPEPEPVVSLGPPPESNPQGRPYAPCGTVVAYRRHLRHRKAGYDVEIDPACAEANRVKVAEWKARTGYTDRRRNHKKK